MKWKNELICLLGAASLMACGKSEEDKKTQVPEISQSKNEEVKKDQKKSEDVKVDVPVVAPNIPPPDQGKIETLMDLEAINKIVSDSEVVSYRWKNRGKAPIGYLHGMSVVFARNYCKLKSNDKFSLEMAKPISSDVTKDALAHYKPQFETSGIEIKDSKEDILRTLFVLQIGLGMRESSGKFCSGRDMSASNTTAETAEAGLFQTSYNSRNSNKLLPEIFKVSIVKPDDLQSVFKVGTTCKEIASSFGTGAGFDFQQLSKTNPAFAVEYTAIAMRNLRKHWGPINRFEVEVKPEVNDMLLEIQTLLDETQGCKF